jgi:hypothetical protein
MKKIGLFLLGFLADWGVNILIFVLLSVLTKMFSPIFVVVFIPLALAYWTVADAVRSGRILGMRKTFSVHEKHMFSLILTVWISPAAWLLPMTIIHMLKMESNMFLWAFLPLSSIAIYCFLVFINPFLKKISESKIR